MSEESDRQAVNFMENETQFHLGFLPTEQSSPLTRNLDREFASGSGNGVRCLQRVDRNVLEMAVRIFRSEAFRKLVETGKETIGSGGKIVFSGCGATGRLSILLECMWRDCCAEHPSVARHADQVFSIMTGGDYALVRSVEFFEDYQEFGRRQVRETGMSGNDMLVAITEGGETSSVLGTVDEALRCGSKVFLLFNNPADLLAEHLERSRRAIRNPAVCVLDLSCGPMALAGSTRMQATTSEQLVAGAALELVMCSLLHAPAPDYAKAFETLLGELEASADAIASYIDFESGVYRNRGKITYFADDYLLDIFTDTTERSPTFMLPPFRKKDDLVFDSGGLGARHASRAALSGMDAGGLQADGRPRGDSGQSAENRRNRTPEIRGRERVRGGTLRFRRGRRRSCDGRRPWGRSASSGGV